MGQGRQRQRRQQAGGQQRPPAAGQQDRHRVPPPLSWYPCRRPGGPPQGEVCHRPAPPPVCRRHSANFFLTSARWRGKGRGL
ncbi:hypothetical protein TSH58p_12725 [Azospirillum sp. TSH58]|nr:hypothetical protein TSH58p_12725 [Azospirillum sp. TSH58]